MNQLDQPKVISIIGEIAFTFLFLFSLGILTTVMLGDGYCIFKVGNVPEETSPDVEGNTTDTILLPDYSDITDMRLESEPALGYNRGHITR